jgi:hypothetical protein
MILSCKKCFGPIGIWGMLENGGLVEKLTDFENNNLWGIDESSDTHMCLLYMVDE